MRKHYKASFRHTVAQENGLIGYLDSYANCATVVRQYVRSILCTDIFLYLLCCPVGLQKKLRFTNPEYRLQKWNLLSLCLFLTSSSTEKENARHFYSIPYQLRAKRRILLRADSMNYNLEKFAKGLKNIIVQLNVDCRTCDLRDSLNQPLITTTTPHLPQCTSAEDIQICCVVIISLITTKYRRRCDGRVVKALDSKSNGIFPRRFESCSQRTVLLLYFVQIVEQVS